MHCIKITSLFQDRKPLFSKVCGLLHSAARVLALPEASASRKIPDWMKDAEAAYVAMHDENGLPKPPGKQGGTAGESRLCVLAEAGTGI